MMPQLGVTSSLEFCGNHRGEVIHKPVLDKMKYCYGAGVLSMPSVPLQKADYGATWLKHSVK